jgi:hypothetical protein
VGGAETEFCTDLANLETAVAQLDSISASSTVDSAEQARDDVEDALNEVRSSARNLAEVRVDQLEDAYEDFDSAVDQVSGDQTLGEAASTLRGDAAQIANARNQLAQSANCP